MKYIFKELALNDLERTNYNSVVDSPYLRIEWLKFLQKWHGYTPKVFNISTEDNEFVGYFCGVEKRVAIWKMMGSPLPGCLGQTMGFYFPGEVENAVEVLDDLLDYLHNQCGYGYITITDSKLGSDVFQSSRYKLIHGGDYVTWFLDIDRPLEDIKKGFSKTYRNYINKFVKTGGTIEEDYSPEFIFKHNEQLRDVYARDGIASPDIIYKYTALLEETKNASMVYCIKANLPGKKNIGSSIYVYSSEWACFLTNASYTVDLQERPNQSLMWNAIQFLREKGIKKMDLVGPGQYKGYYGADSVIIPVIVCSPNPIIYRSMVLLRKAYYKSFRWKMIIRDLFKKKDQINDVE